MFVYKVADSHKRVMEHHPWSAVRHDGAYLFSHFRFVALYRAGITGAFMIMGTSGGSCLGVLNDFKAVRTEVFVVCPDMVVAMAEYACHSHNGFVVSLESFKIF